MSHLTAQASTHTFIGEQKKTLRFNPSVILNYVTALPGSVRMDFKLFSQSDHLFRPWLACSNICSSKLQHDFGMCFAHPPGTGCYLLFFCLFICFYNRLPDSHPARRRQKMSVHLCVCRSVFSPGSSCGIIMQPELLIEGSAGGSVRCSPARTLTTCC